jgi:hypothetical protein
VARNWDYEELYGRDIEDEEILLARSDFVGSDGLGEAYLYERDLYYYD